MGNMDEHHFKYNRNYRKAAGCFNRDMKKNASENSIILSLVEYSRLRERIRHGA